MATTAELQAKLDEYKAAEAATEAAKQKSDADRDAAEAAVTQASQSHQAWVDALTHQHQLDDEFDALSAAHEPPALPT